MEVRMQDRPILVEKEIHLSLEKYLPDVWRASQALVGSQSEKRFQALKQLDQMEIIRFSPLLAYLVATRLNDANPELCFHAMLTLLSVLEPDSLGQPAPDEVRSEVFSYLCDLSKKTVLSILKTSLDHLEQRSEISKFLNLCPIAGKHLSAILMDRSQSIAIRCQAVDLIGLIGFVDTKSTLLRIKSRIDSRMNNNGIQLASATLEDEKSLLLSINTALTLLQNP